MCCFGGPVSGTALRSQKRCRSKLPLLFWPCPKKAQFLVPEMRTDGCAKVRWRSEKNGKVGLICGSGNATVLRLQFLNRRYIPHHGRRHFLGRKTVAFSGPQFLTTASPSFGFVLTKIGIFADQLYDFCRVKTGAQDGPELQRQLLAAPLLLVFTAQKVGPQICPEIRNVDRCLCEVWCPNEGVDMECEVHSIGTEGL